MPSEYESLVAALKTTDIPFAEYGWQARPEGNYGVVALDFENDGLFGDDRKIDRSWEASVDVFFPKIKDRADIVQTVEEILEEICGGSWSKNSFQHETTTGLFHIEWVCTVMDTLTEDEN